MKDSDKNFWCITFGGEYYNTYRYVSKLTRSKLFSVELHPFAKKFKTEVAAERWIIDHRVLQQYSKFHFRLVRVVENRISDPWRALKSLTLGTAESDRLPLEEKWNAIWERANKALKKIDMLGNALKKRYPAFEETLTKRAKSLLSQIKCSNQGWAFIGENKNRQKVYENKDEYSCPRCFWDNESRFSHGYRPKDDELVKSGAFQTEAETWEREFKAANEDWFRSGKPCPIGRNLKGEIIYNSYAGRGVRGRWVGEEYVTEKAPGYRNGSDFELTSEVWEREEPRGRKILMAAEINASIIDKFHDAAVSLYEDNKLQPNQQINKEGVNL
jgi:hypothetical protein